MSNTAAKFKAQFDHVWGIDRYPNSLDYGEIVVPNIALWDKAGGLPVGARTVGAAMHDTQVRVLEKQMIDDRAWYKVAYGGHAELEGWVMDRLLKDRGAEAFE